MVKNEILMKRAFVITMILAFAFIGAARAAPSEDQNEILKLNDTVQEKRTRLQELQSRVDEYQTEISKLQSKSISLNNQIALLENKIAKTELDIEAIGVNIDKIDAEIELIDYEIAQKENRITENKQTLAEVLREIYAYDQQSSAILVFGAQAFSDFYQQLHFLEDVQGRLQDTLDEVKEAKAAQEQKRDQRKEQLASLEDLQKELEQKEILLGDEQGSKEILLLTTRSSEAGFQNLLREIKEETQFVDSQLNTLETQLSDRLRGLDVDFGGGTLFSPPLGQGAIITAYFHDPTYPYRYLFEHTGTDFRASVGTPIAAAAPGIVAVAHTGRSYGNYVVIMHANGYSTLYAHLSRIMVSPEQFVERGQTIGLSGGARGAPGAGLSTGPHLHFEVRANGIPVNPLEYLVSF